MGSLPSRGAKATALKFTKPAEVRWIIVMHAIMLMHFAQMAMIPARLSGLRIVERCGFSPA